MITAYRNLRFKVQAMELSRKISYETKKLEKNIKKVKNGNYKTVTQNIWDHRKKGYKIPKKAKYTTKEKGKKQAGYILNPSKKGKKGPKKKLGAKIPWGVGTKIVLYPYFAKQPKKRNQKSRGNDHEESNQGSGAGGVTVLQHPLCQGSRGSICQDQ